MSYGDRFSLLETSWETIEGWANPDTLPIWRYLLRKQREFEIHGHTIEIGPFMGKCASILAADINPEKNEKLVLVDTNIRRTELESALKLAGLETRDSVQFYEMDSRQASAQSLNINPRSTRWLHIDGEHSGSAVTNDLDVAHELVKEGGIVVLDDFFAGAYPQITFSVVRYLDRYRERFVPILISFGKLYLSRPNQAFWYKQHIAIQIIAELAKSGLACSLCKTASSEDLDCFSIIPDSYGRKIRGPDWDGEAIQVARRFSAEQIDAFAQNIADKT